MVDDIQCSSCRAKTIRRGGRHFLGSLVNTLSYWGKVAFLFLKIKLTIVVYKTFNLSTYGINKFSMFAGSGSETNSYGFRSE